MQHQQSKENSGSIMKPGFAGTDAQNDGNPAVNYYWVV